MKQFPTKASQFLARIEACHQIERWKVEVAPSECDDAHSTRRVIFTLDGHAMSNAYVAEEHGSMHVTLEGYYWFTLDRLHENHATWPWRNQLAEKSWCGRQHLELLDALNSLFPVADYAE
ncbi:hypothetical protein ACN8ZM_39885 (plasmid) [Burkholderia aenigmatica]|uniref:hypothetical protein n=1 Tax=Burkholderia aenigmatica TaxID=2015348 RepID=UPI003B42BA3C